MLVDCLHIDPCVYGVAHHDRLSLRFWLLNYSMARQPQTVVGGGIAVHASGGSSIWTAKRETESTQPTFAIAGTRILANAYLCPSVSLCIVAVPLIAKCSKKWREVAWQGLSVAAKLACSDLPG